MNVSYRWIRALAPTITASPGELAERLAALGFPVESVTALAEDLAGIVVGRVEAVREHPGADRLVLCDVDAGEGVVQVVCGAPNVEPGAYYPFAPPGASLPSGTVIRKARIRGQDSRGMLCSERELGVGPDEAGILRLPGEFRPGAPLPEALGLDDHRLDVEVTANRPDLLSQEGVAREVAPGGHGDLRLPPIPGEDPEAGRRVEGLPFVSDAKEASGDGVTIRVEAPELCGRYLGLVVRGVRPGPSPPWLQARLRAVGARPINNVVDATNYVLLELGQPLHAFDLARLKERTVVVRKAREGEGIRTLDGVDRTLGGEMLAICDARDPIAVAGVMGGEESEVSEGTSDVLLECAHFTPGPVRTTRKALGLSTDASYRFERGVDPEGMRRAVLRAARIIVAAAGGRVTGPVVECRPVPFTRSTVRLRTERVGRVLGVPFAPDEAAGLLRPLGFGIREEGGDLDVEVPGFRSYDVRREVDLIEEVARTHGYDRFPEQLGAFRPGTVPDDPLFLLEDRIRDELSARGLLEAHVPAFAPRDEGEVEILNPVSKEEGFLRSRLLPGLLRRVERNLARGNRDVRLYELGTVFLRRGSGELPREEPHVAVVLHGRRSPAHWSGTGGDLDLWDLKGLLERLTRVIPEGPWEVCPGPDGGGREEAVLDPSVSFAVVDGAGSVMGRGGRVLPTGLDLPRWAGPIFALELSLPHEPRAGPPATYEPLPRFPAVERDLALLLRRDVPVATALDRIGAEGTEHLRSVRVFDVYTGEELPDGTRSVAVRLRFRAEDRTLTDREVDGAVEKVVRTLQEELGVGIRGQEG